MKIKAMLGVLGLSAAVSAQALVIDFTDGDLWKGGSTVYYGSLGVTVEAFDSTGASTSYNNSQSFDGTPQDPCQAWGPLQCETDGLGIANDEVSFGEGEKTDVERLKITFTEAIDIESLVFLDLFLAGANPSDPVTEVAQAQFNGDGGPGAVWSGTANDDTGFLVATLGNADVYSSAAAFTGVTMIEFFADTFRASSPSNTDFAVAAINTVSVPEPGSLALMGLGLLGLGACRKRQK